MPGLFPIPFGRYQLIEPLALGGMAQLFLAQSSGAHGFEKTVVIKRILPELARDSHFTSMFISEAKLTAQLVHPKIAQTYELGTEANQLFIAMEYVDGLDVLAILRELAHLRTRLRQELCVYIAKEVLDALDFAHNLTDQDGKLLGIVHRDISPSNIVLSRRGDVKLVDFGIAHALDSEHKTRAGTLKGKYGYMSPEQVLGKAVSSRSDLFSTGIVLAEMLMGRRLFAASAELDVLLMVRDVNLARLDKFGSHIDESLRKILERALTKDPEARFSSARAFAETLDEWLFETRNRVTGNNLAELIESLYEPALVRRREQLAKSEFNALGAPAEAPADESARGTPTDPPPSDRLGQMSGEVIAVDAKAVAAKAKHTELAESAEDMKSTIRSKARAKHAEPPGPESVVIEVIEPSTVAGELAARTASSFELKVGSLGPSIDPSKPLIELGEIGDSADAAVTHRVPVLADRIPEDPNVLEAADLAELELSVRYPTIEAAVAAAVPQAPDPASRDFDDNQVSGDELSLSARVSQRLPTAREVATAPKPSPPKLDTLEAIPDDGGSLEECPIVAVMLEHALARSTGLLVTAFGPTRKDIYIRDGVPEFVSSNVASELFGAYLVKERAISEGELDMALAMMPHYGGKLGDTLVGLGLIKPLEVFRHLTKQIRSRILDVCSWEKGEYSWYNGKTNEREAFPLDLDPFEVAGAGAMLISSHFIVKWADANRDVKPVSKKHPTLLPESFRLGGALRQTYDKLTGRHSIGELMGRYSVEQEREDFLRRAYLLLVARLAKAK